MKKLSNSDILEIISETNQKITKKKITKITDKKNLSTEQKLKISICRLFVQFLNEKNIRPVELQKLTGIELSRISEIINYKINKFTIDKLLKWGEILAPHSPKVKAHFLLFSEILNAPAMSVAKTKSIVRTIRTHIHL